MSVRSVLLVGSPGLPIAALAALLRSSSHLEVLGPVTDSATAQQYMPLQALDLVIADWDNQPLLRCVITEIRRRRLAPRLLFVGPTLAPHELIAMRTLGIAGYLSRSDLDPISLRAAVRAAVCGYFVLGQGAAGLSPHSLLPQTNPDSATPLLTDREAAVLQGIAAGWNESRIADSEGVSTRTVKRTVMALKAKLDAASLSALTIQAEHRHLTSSARHTPGN